MTNAVKRILRLTLNPRATFRPLLHTVTRAQLLEYVLAGELYPSLHSKRLGVVVPNVTAGSFAGMGAICQG